MDRALFVRLLAGLRAILYISAFVLLSYWLTLWFRGFDHWISSQILPNWIAILGAGVFLAGAGLVVTCAGAFAAQGKGTPAIFDPPREFVVVGPYRYVRNPMYIGGFALLFGLALWYGSISMLTLCLVAIPPLHLFVLFVEEPQLERRFAQRYVRYKRSVNRWIPRRP